MTTIRRTKPLKKGVRGFQKTANKVGSNETKRTFRSGDIRPKHRYRRVKCRK